MNNKENTVDIPIIRELSAQQRARISQNFRAAKERLARKRNHSEFVNRSLNNHKSGNEKESGIKRVPLSTISNNLISPVPLKLPNMNYGNGCEINNVVKDFSWSRSGNEKESGIKRVPLATISTSLISPVPLSLPNKNNVNGCEINNVPMDFSWSRSGNGKESGIKRPPLSNIPNNPMSPVPLNLPYKNGDCGSGSIAIPVRQAKWSSTPCLSDASDFRFAVNGERSAIEKLSHPPEDISDVNSCINSSSQHDSLNQPGGLNSYASSLEPLLCLASTVINDDFDDSFFAEIDAICEQHSAVKSEKEYREVNKMNESVTEYCGEENRITNIDPEDKNTNCGQISESFGDQSCDVKNVGKSDDKQYECMPDEYAKYIQSLNDRQQEAACSDISVPLVIIAGPGSGKTSTMVGRVLMLLNKGIGPSNILAMTFTTAAAAEMRERIASVAGKATAKELTISTFHSFSLQLCRLHAEKLGRTSEFLIYGHGQQRKAIIEAVRILEDGKRKANPEPSKLTELSNVNSPKHFKDQSKKWLKFVTQAKAAGRSPEYFRKRGDETGALILQNYSDILKSCNALDYHDFISCSLQLLTDFPEVFQECQESWKAIVIDEFQDTSSMQYGLLKILASHKRITIVGDEDQSIFGFNGADVSGFDSFRKDFSTYKEVRLNRNYRSTRCIVEAASFLIKNNLNRCNSKDATTDKSYGSKITVKECFNEDAQCSFVVDKILAVTSDGSSDKCSYGQIAVLYRRQVTGKMFQTAFRSRNIPFNMHGVAFYRKKVVRAIIAMLSTTLPGCDDDSFRRVFKALLPLENEEKKKVIEHIDKVSTIRRCSFVTAAGDIFRAKLSGTFKRTQLTQGRKVLLTLDMISKLVQREQSISAVITSVANMIPQKYLLEQRAVLDVDGGKLLNEDNDIRSVLQYLLDDLSLFLTTIFKNVAEGDNSSCITEGKGCMNTLKAFVDYISLRERENFRTRKHDNEDSVTLTTIHQSKGLEWDTVFIVKTNEAEIPLLHEFNGTVNQNGSSIEEERRLLYVAMTRARKKLFMLYLLMDPNWQVLQPSRFLREIPYHLLETQDELMSASAEAKNVQMKQKPQVSVNLKTESSETNPMQHVSHDNSFDEGSEKPCELTEYSNGNNFLKRFSTDDRAVVSHLFHQWAKKPAFHDPKRLLSKVGFVIDERLRAKKCTHKDVLRELKSCLTSEESLQFALSVLKWEQLPAEKRSYIMREKQEHFQKLRIENAMGSSEATPKQIAYLQSLGCTIIPSSRLHASRLIEEYKSL